MTNLFVPLLITNFIANFIAIVIGVALLLLAVIGTLLCWQSAREVARLALCGGTLLPSGILFLVLFQNGLYCMAGCG